MPAPDDGNVLPFRRRKGVPVRRRHRGLRLLRPFLLALALVGTPAAGLYWSGTSPRFAVSELQVVTSDRVNRAWMEARLQHLVGRNLVWMSMESVERSLSGHPWIAGVEVTKSLPDRLRVAVVERHPVALLEVGSERWYVDRSGRVIAPVGDEETPPGESRRQGRYLLLGVAAAAAGVKGVPGAAGAPEPDPTGQPVRRAVLARALDVVQSFSRAAPDWAAGLSQVEILGEEDFRLETGALPFELLVEAGQVEGRVRAFEDLLPRLLARFPAPKSVDLRFSHRIVVRGAGRPAATAINGRGEAYAQAG
jgi:cell division protein FtsQ